MKENEIKALIYTINPIENLNRTIKKLINTSKRKTYKLKFKEINDFVLKYIKWYNKKYKK